MRLFVSSAIRGELPLAACWWITDSSLTFARKAKASDTDAPRPLRVGETLRRYVAKRIAVAEKTTMRKMFVQRRQFGVACPGGAEILIHHRVQTREYTARLRRDPLITWDSDIANCFGTILWTAIDDSVERHIPGALPWTRWCHSARVRVLLPGGGVHMTERGAEQGDPLGSAYAAAVIVDVCDGAAQHLQQLRTALNGMIPTSESVLAAIDAQRKASATDLSEDLRACQFVALLPPAINPDLAAAWDAAATTPLSAATPPRVCDVWYIDDSCVRGDPVDGDLWLAAWDLAAAATGMQRSATKSLVRGGSASAAIPPYSAATCKIAKHDETVKWLGVRIGDASAQLAAKVEEVAALHSAIGHLDDPALELLLTRACADAAKVMHLLRAVAPHDLTDRHLLSFDNLMTDAVGRIVRAAPEKDAADQAAWGVKAGGLGLRRATTMALPAHVASLVESEPLVTWLSRECAARGVIGVDDDVSHKVRTDAAVQHLLRDIQNERTREEVRADIAKQRDSVDLAADPAVVRPPATGRPPPRPPPAPGEGARDAGDATKRSDAPGGRACLQRKILRAIDQRSLTDTMSALRAVSSPSEHQSERLLRLQDLADRGTCHDWLWSVNPAHGPVLSPAGYITALRLRLGIPIGTYSGERPCAECQLAVSAAWLGPHALVCARGKRVLGHNLLRDHLADLARASDPRARLEVAFGSPPHDNRRPADLLLSASPFGGRAGAAAVDVGIVAPHNATAMVTGTDPIVDYIRRKRDKSEVACTANGWSFHPFILSAYGRPHPDATRLVHRLCVRAAREFVAEPPDRLEASWWRNASTLLMERAVLMVDRCRPAPAPASPPAGGRDSLWGIEPHRPLPRRAAAASFVDVLVSGAEAPIPHSE
jgi:hypothetical protein